MQERSGGNIRATPRIRSLPEMLVSAAEMILSDRQRHNHYSDREDGKALAPTDTCRLTCVNRSHLHQTLTYAISVSSKQAPDAICTRILQYALRLDGEISQDLRLQLSSRLILAFSVGFKQNKYTTVQKCVCVCVCVWGGGG